MLLSDRTFYSMIDSAGSTVQLPEHFTGGTYEYRRGGNPTPDPEGRRFLLEIGNEKTRRDKAPFKLILRFKVFENCDRATIQGIINGERGAWAPPVV